MYGCNKKNDKPAIPADIFCITSLEDGLEVSMKLYNENYPHTIPSLLYSTDGYNWADFIIGKTVVTLSKSGTKLFIKANERNTAFGYDPGGNEQFVANYNSFKFNKKVKITGNIMYLLDGEHPETAEMGDLAFFGLFLRDSLLMDASELILPSTKLSNECYTEMFENTSISKAPELPATELAPYCYSSMFNGCRNLIYIPELPANKLDTACYHGMFCDCQSLTETCKLPATQLAPSCYAYMFSGCTSLTTGPKLPATQLTPYCYYRMFSECTSMTSLTCLATNINAEKCVSGWLRNINTKGTLHAVSGIDWTKRIPVSWTVEY